jgi:indolepyruvate decarboxylase
LTQAAYWQAIQGYLRPGDVLIVDNGTSYALFGLKFGKTAPYNDISNWTYADLLKVFRPDTSPRSFVVKTSWDVQDALSAPNDTMIFVESIMDLCDALAPITNSSNKGARFYTAKTHLRHRSHPTEV